MSSPKASPGTISCGSRAEARCVPFMAAPVTCVTVPSGATSESRAIQFARVAFAATVRMACGNPRISRSSSSGPLS